MLNQVGRCLLLVVAVIGAAFALIYTIDYALLITSLSVNARTSGDFIRFAFAVGVFALLVAAGDVLLRPQESSSRFIEKRNTPAKRLLFMLTLTIPVSCAIFALWLATEL